MLKKAFKNNCYLFIFIILYFSFHLFFLTKFPFVHSDEAWLSGLTRNIMSTKNIFSTEAFFDLYPRYPHSIKILFHLMQIPFIKIFGYSIFSVRMISLLFSTFSLLLFYRMIKNQLKSEVLALLTTILLCLNIQFIYASHFARQEIVLLFFFLICMNLYFNSTMNPVKSTIIIGVLIGLSIGIHPNSFLLAFSFGSLYLLDWIYKKKSFRSILVLVGVVSAFTLFFVGLSYLGDRDFLTHYLQYGSSFGVDLSLKEKLFTLDDFYIKLYNRISGTYYVPDLQAFTALSLLIILLSTFFLKRHLIRQLLVSILAINIGIVLIGRFNATTILFLIPLLYFLAAILINLLVKGKRAKIIACSLLILLSALDSFAQIYPYLSYDYNDYLEEISKAVPKDGKTLGNLSSFFYFENDALLDYRNLSYLEENNIDFADYIEKNNIEYIIYYEELDYIHRNQNWLILYGEDSYYDDMQTYLEKECRQIHSFTNALYGIRVPRYMMDYNWEIRIYKVNEYIIA